MKLRFLVLRGVIYIGSNLDCITKKLLGGKLILALSGRPGLLEFDSTYSGGFKGASNGRIVSNSRDYTLFTLSKAEEGRRAR